MNKKNLLIGLIIMGCLGTILFFPVNINNHYTCLFHRIIDGNPASPNITLHHKDNSMHHSILDIYLEGYAFIWWASILALVTGIYYYRTKNKVYNY